MNSILVFLTINSICSMSDGFIYLKRIKTILKWNLYLFAGRAVNNSLALNVFKANEENYFRVKKQD